MNKLILLAVIVLGITEVGFAQDNPTYSPCRIWYDYDNAGQRVKRYYQCLEDIEQHTDGRIRATLFPNPTDGPVIVVTDVPVDELSVVIYNIGGVLITNASCVDCSQLSLDISDQLIGSYVVQVTALKQGYPNFSQGYTVIKND